MVYGYGYQYWRDRQILSAGVTFPPNPEQQLLWLDGIYQDDNEWKLTDKSNGYNCDVVESNCISLDGASNFVSLCSANDPNLLNMHVVIVPNKIETSVPIGNFNSAINKGCELVLFASGKIGFILRTTAGSTLVYESNENYAVGNTYWINLDCDAIAQTVTLNVNGVESLYNITAPFQLDGTLIIGKQASGAPFFYEGLVLDLSVEQSCKFSFANGREGYVVDTISGHWYEVQGDVAELHTTSSGKPHNAIDKTDVYRLISDPTKKLYVPYKADGTQIPLDVAFAALYEFEDVSPAGVMYNTESKLLLPNVQALIDAAALFTNNILFDGGGNPTAFAMKDLTTLSFDYEQAKTLFTNISNINENGMLLWYNTPQEVDDFNSIAEAFGALQPYQVTEGNYKVTEGDYFVTT